MHVERHPVAADYCGPLQEAVPHVPDDVLYDVELHFAHDEPEPARLATTLRAAATTVAGRVRVQHLPFFGLRLRARDGRHPLTVRARNGTVSVRLDHRVKGRGLAKVVAAFTAVPGARDLHIEATTPRFDSPFADVGPCTPCAAGRFPARR